MKLTSPSGKLVSSTPPSRGELTYISSTLSSDPTRGQIQVSSTPSPTRLAILSGTTAVIPLSNRPITSQRLISTTLPPMRSEVEFIPADQPSQIRNLSPQSYQENLLSTVKQLTSQRQLYSAPSSTRRPELTYVASGRPSTIQSITPQEYPRLSTSSGRSERLTLITRGPGSEYDYYDATVFSQLPPNSKVLVLPSGSVQCLDRGNFPHPSSCKKFISCYEGGVGEGIIGWEYTCPRGLSFDPVGGICNWSAGLGCKQLN